MPKVYKKRERGYTNIANNIMDDETISYKAVGIFVSMWRKPDGWDFNIQALANDHKDGKQSVSSGLDELIEHGYVERIANRNKGQFGGYDYVLHEVPKSQKGDTVPPKPQKRYTEKRDTENGAQVNTIYNNYYLTNKTTTNNLIKSKLKANGISPNESTVAMVSEFLQTMEIKAVFYAIEKTGKAARPSANYLEKILKDNQKHQILTYDQAVAVDEQRQRLREPPTAPEPSGQHIPIFKMGVAANDF